MRIIPVLGICLSNELAPPQPLAAQHSHQILNFCRPTLVRVFEKFDFPGKSLWCIERALFHMAIFPPLSCVASPLGTKFQAFTSRSRCVNDEVYLSDITSIPWRVPAAFTVLWCPIIELLLPPGRLMRVSRQRIGQFKRMLVLVPTPQCGALRKRPGCLPCLLS